MKKKLITITLLSTTLGLSTINVSAEPHLSLPSSSITLEDNFDMSRPYYQNIRDISVRNTRNKNSLHIYANITVTLPTNISMTTKLEKYRNGKWSTVKTWSSKKSSTMGLVLSKSYTITKGYKYRTCATFKCGNEQGKKYSNIVSY